MTKEYVISFTTTLKGVESRARRVVWAESESEARKAFLLCVGESQAVKIRSIKEA